MTTNAELLAQSRYAGKASARQNLQLTPEQYANHQKLVRQDSARKRFQALGRLPKDQMNKTEAAYSKVLEQRKLAGEILDWKFHPMNVRLAAGVFYEVDFLVLTADMQVQIHETKGGYTTDKGQMKIRLCADALPWFAMFKAKKLSAKDGGGWNIEEY